MLIWADPSDLGTYGIRKAMKSLHMPCVEPEGGGGGGGGQGVRTHLKNHKAIGFLTNTSPDPLKNHIATKPAANVGPSSTRHRNAILMAFRWWANDGPLLVVFGSSLPSSLKKKHQSWTPCGKIFWIRTCIHIVWKQKMVQSKKSDL